MCQMCGTNILIEMTPMVPQGNVAGAAEAVGAAVQVTPEHAVVKTPKMLWGPFLKRYGCAPAISGLARPWQIRCLALEAPICPFIVLPVTQASYCSLSCEINVLLAHIFGGEIQVFVVGVDQSGFIQVDPLWLRVDLVNI